MSTVQDEIRNFIDKTGLRLTTEARLLDVLSELGELAKEVLKASRYDRQPIVEKKHIADELGDVLFSALALAYECNLDADELVRSAIAKYQHRIATRGTAGS
jgi:NTP pyrophosphatase (non-canonical NTP hydrolase)